VHTGIDGCLDVAVKRIVSAKAEKPKDRAR